MLLREYFAAIWVHWWPLMSCAAFTVLAVLADLHEKTQRWATRISLGLALFFLFLSSYMAWRVEYVRSHPQLQLTIYAIDIGMQVYGDASSQPGIIVEAGVANLGSLTIADSWHLAVVSSKGKKIFDGGTTGMANGKPFEFGKKFTLDSSDLLYKKTIFPIAEGGKENGFLIFLLPHTITEDELIIPGTQLILYCKDVYGNEVHGEHVINGSRQEGFPFVPGTHEPQPVLSP